MHYPFSIIHYPLSILHVYYSSPSMGKGGSPVIRIIGWLNTMCVLWGKVRWSTSHKITRIGSWELGAGHWELGRETIKLDWRDLESYRVPSSSQYRIRALSARILISRPIKTQCTILLISIHNKLLIFSTWYLLIHIINNIYKSFGLTKGSISSKH